MEANIYIYWYCIVYAKGEGGGGGAYSRSVIDVNPDDEFQIYVGAGGGNKGTGRGGKQAGDDTSVSGIVDGSPAVIVMAKGGLPGDGALTQSNPNGGTYLRGGQADEGIGDIKHNGGNGATYNGPNTGYNAGGGGGAAGFAGDGGHAGVPNNYNPGIGNTGGRWWYRCYH